MRFFEFIKSRSFAIAAVFILAALAASKISSPWREGPLLTLKPALPQAIVHHVPLVQWPEPVQDTSDFRFDLGIEPSPDDSSTREVTPEDRHDASAEVPSKAEEAQPSTPRRADDAPSDTAETETAEVDADTAAPPKPPTDLPDAPSKAEGVEPAASARAQKPDAVNAQKSRDSDEAVAPSAPQEPQKAKRPPLPYERMLARIYSPSADEPMARLRPPAPDKKAVKRVDPRDKKLLESLKKLRSNLPSSGDFLSIPCVDPDAKPTEAPNACTQRALDNFYASLRDRAFGKAGHTRWMQYGDSLVIGDTMTGELRRLFQQQFGDGGHGWIYIGHPLRPVRAENIRVYPNDAWYIRTIVRHSESGGDLFGLGGAEFRPTDDANLLLSGTREKGLGDTLERFALYYFAPPGVESASFHLTVNGKTHTENLVAEPGSSNVHTFDVPPGNHRIQLSSFSPRVRYYGLVSETSGPGVVIDNLGLVSARQEHLLKLNAEQWHDQLALREPDVVAFFYGVNAASSNRSRSSARSEQYIKDYSEVIRRAMHNAPNRDCVVLSLLTRGVREGNKIHPTGAVEVLNKIQKKTAISSGCAFFDTTGVMGGPDGTQAWVNHRPPLLGADLSHPTRPGYHRLARQLYTNLIDGFIDYMERRMTRGGDEQ